MSCGRIRCAPIQRASTPDGEIWDPAGHQVALSAVSARRPRQRLRPRLKSDARRRLPELTIECGKDEGLGRPSPARRARRQAGRHRTRAGCDPTPASPHGPPGLRGQGASTGSGHSRANLRCARRPPGPSSTPRRTARPKADATSARLTKTVVTPAASAVRSMTSLDPRSVTYRFTSALASRYGITRGSPAGCQPRCASPWAHVRLGATEPAPTPQDRAGVLQGGEPLVERWRLGHHARHSSSMLGDDDRRAHLHIPDTLAQLRLEFADPDRPFAHGILL